MILHPTFLPTEGKMQILIAAIPKYFSTHTFFIGPIFFPQILYLFFAKAVREGLKVQFTCADPSCWASQTQRSKPKNILQEKVIFWVSHCPLMTTNDDLKERCVTAASLHIPRGQPRLIQVGGQRWISLFCFSNLWDSKLFCSEQKCKTLVTLYFAGTKIFGGKFGYLRRCFLFQLCI